MKLGVLSTTHTSAASGERSAARPAPTKPRQPPSTPLFLLLGASLLLSTLLYSPCSKLRIPRFLDLLLVLLLLLVVVVVLLLPYLNVLLCCWKCG
jgi:hypothetical protein